MVEGARLESVFRGNSNVGSNPTLSAIAPVGNETKAANSIRGSPPGEFEQFAPDPSLIHGAGFCHFFGMPDEDSILRRPVWNHRRIIRL